jgi:hypothetical protein
VVSTTSTYLLVFRTIHILGGIAWVGTVFTLVIFLQPTAKAVGPAGAPFMRELLGRRKLANVILAIAGVTIVSGGFTYWHDVDVYGSFGDFVTSSFGGWLTFGAVAAIAAVLIGLFFTKPTIDESMRVGAQIAQAGDAPPPELLMRLGALGERGRRLAITNLVLVSIAAFAMASARSW